MTKLANSNGGVTTSNSVTPNILRNAMLFSLTRHAWSNRSQADRTRVETTGDKKALNLTKQLLRSPELDQLTRYLDEVYKWALDRSALSNSIRRGIYFVKRDQITAFEARLAEANAKIRNDLIPAFLASYEDRKKEMRTLPASEGGLGDLYNEGDYPLPAKLSAAFGLSWSWLALSVPDDLPDEVRTREVKKLQESFLEAQEEIRFALREGFKAIVERAVERLTVKDGEKPKIFRDTLVTNFNDFFETFSAKNLMDDDQLSAVVAQARSVVQGLPKDITVLRNSDGVRASAASQFAKVNEAMSALVIERPSRKFDFDS